MSKVEADRSVEFLSVHGAHPEISFDCLPNTPIGGCKTCAAVIFDADTDVPALG